MASHRGIAEAALDPSALVEIDPEEDRHTITAYDLRIEVRNAGERTYCEGWIYLGDERHHLVVAANVPDQGTTPSSTAKRPGGQRSGGSTSGSRGFARFRVVYRMPGLRAEAHADGTLDIAVTSAGASDGGGGTLSPDTKGVMPCDEAS